MYNYLVSAQKVVKPGDTVEIKEVNTMSKKKITSQETIDMMEDAHGAWLVDLRGGIPSWALSPSELLFAKCADFSADSATLPEYTSAMSKRDKYVTFRRRRFDRANFDNQDLNGYDFTGGSFTDASFFGTSLIHADMSHSRLQGAHFARANLEMADLTNANLTNADFKQANLRGANLAHANLNEADLAGADLTGANLTDAILTGACLYKTCLDGVIGLYCPMACPSEGSFIGWKKAILERPAPSAVYAYDRCCLIKLEIPADAKRSSGTGRKCRANKAKVLEIYGIQDGTEADLAYSFYDGSFVYRKGEMVEVPDFDEKRFNECAAGIHFFIDREEAIRYEL